MRKPPSWHVPWQLVVQLRGHAAPMSVPFSPQYASRVLTVPLGCIAVDGCLQSKGFADYFYAYPSHHALTDVVCHWPLHTTAVEG